ncbi:MAG: (d)CMP kinase [Lactobacillales bacterium]|jgi:cytidylate kinase|nr:(d)CMP kinase [Lactobacillales bacterium]
MKKINIAIDGPASSGKSTVAKILAKKYEYTYLDTGSMYRVLTYCALKEKVNIEEEIVLIKLLQSLHITFQQGDQDKKVFVNGQDVSREIRLPDVTNLVSVVAAHRMVREEMVKLQKEYAKLGGVVMDGRDIGTMVLPNAEVKIFLVASIQERAERRFLENQSKGIPADFEKLKKEIEERDFLDSTREVSPLQQAKDAILVDTTGLSINEVVEKIEEVVRIKEGF